MRIEHGQPGERLRAPGEEVRTPRQAAAVIPVRGESEKLELLLTQRNPNARFMGGAWVFPGGAVDAADGTGLSGYRCAAARELAEEVQIEVDPSDLSPFAHWITPEDLAVRFDTYFFVATLPPDSVPTPDGEECVDVRWIAPADALAQRDAGELAFAFPTVKKLEQLMAFSSADQLLDSVAGNAELAPVIPRVIVREGAAWIALPGEPEYDSVEL